MAVKINIHYNYYCDNINFRPACNNLCYHVDRYTNDIEKVTCKSCKKTNIFKQVILEVMWPRLSKIGSFLRYEPLLGPQRCLNITTRALTNEEMEVFLDLVLEKLTYYLPKLAV